jgi:hypothetical protein
MNRIKRLESQVAALRAGDERRRGLVEDLGVARRALASWEKQAP